MHNEIPSDHFWIMMMDELVDLDEERPLALDALIRQKKRIAKTYNKKVKSKVFSIGYYVWKVIIPLRKKDIGFRDKAHERKCGTYD